MDSKRDGAAIEPLRMSDRLRQRRKIFGHRAFVYYKPAIRKKNKVKRRTAASQIAKMLRPRNRPNSVPPSDTVAANLRRSTRKRKISINLDHYETDSSRTDDDLMAPMYRSTRSKVENNASHDELSASPRNKKILNAKGLPRREGLRPRRSLRGTTIRAYQESEDEHESFEAQAEQDEAENWNAVENGRNKVDGDVGDEVEVEMKMIKNRMVGGDLICGIVQRFADLQKKRRKDDST